MNQYQYGLCEWLFPIPGPTAFRLAGKLGFDGVQMLDYGGRENNYPLTLPWVQDIFREAMAESGVVIQTLQLQSLVRNGGVKCNPNTPAGKEALEDIRKGAEVCAALGIPNLQLENFFASALSVPEDFDNTAALLREAGKITQGAGVQLIYESWLDYAGTMRMYEAARESFRLCYDTLNPLRYHFGDPLDDLRKYDLALIDFIHVKDAPEGYQGSVCLGEGAGLFAEACAILKERNYTGWIVSENYYCMDPIGKEDPSVTAARDLATMKEAFSK